MGGMGRVGGLRMFTKLPTVMDCTLSTQSDNNNNIKGLRA